MNRLFAVGFAFLCAGTSVVPLTTQPIGVHLFAAFFGWGQGMVLAVSSPMWVRYYGRRNLGKIRGTVWCSTVAGSGCGPFILGTFYDSFGTFRPGLWLFAALLLLLIPFTLLATAPDFQPSQPVTET
jgi:MFS family permease